MSNIVCLTLTLFIYFPYISKWPSMRSLCSVSAALGSAGLLSRQHHGLHRGPRAGGPAEAVQATRSTPGFRSIAGTDISGRYPSAHNATPRVHLRRVFAARYVARSIDSAHSFLSSSPQPAVLEVLLAADLPGLKHTDDVAAALQVQFEDISAADELAW